MWRSSNIPQRSRKLAFLRGSLVPLIAASIILPTLIFAGAITQGPVPPQFAPGVDPTWSPSTNTILGTARTDNSSLVWFTGFNGIVGEVFYPSPDTPATVDWQFLVGDSAGTWVDEEKKDTTSQVSLADPRSLAWKVTNKANNNKYTIEKTIFTDPTRDTLVVQVIFTAQSGKLAIVAATVEGVKFAIPGYHEQIVERVNGR